MTFIGGGEVVVKTGESRRLVSVQWRGRTGEEAEAILAELEASSGVDAIEGWESPPRMYRSQGSFSWTRTTGDFHDVAATLEAVEDL